MRCVAGLRGRCDGCVRLSLRMERLVFLGGVGVRECSVVSSEACLFRPVEPSLAFVNVEGVAEFVISLSCLRLGGIVVVGVVKVVEEW